MSGDAIDEPQPLSTGMWRLPVPLPGHSVGHVNVYAFVDGTDVLVVDTGWAGSFAALGELLARIGARIDDVRRVVTTHVHVDHCGLAGTLRDRVGARVAMHTLDAALLPSRYFDRKPYVEATVAWARAVGLPPDGEAFALSQVATLSTHVAPFAVDDELLDGERIPFGRWELEALHTPGHTPGHCCFHERATGALLTGDHVFPGIRASPTYRPQSPADPVGDYLSSFQRLRRLRAASVLPGHQRPFDDLDRRLDELAAYHRRRLRGLHAALATSAMTVYEVCAHLSRSRAWHERPWRSRLSSVGETYAHLRHLERHGAIARSGTTPQRWRAGAFPASVDTTTIGENL